MRPAVWIGMLGSAALLVGAVHCAMVVAEPTRSTAPSAPLAVRRAEPAPPEPVASASRAQPRDSVAPRPLEAARPAPPSGRVGEDRRSGSLVALERDAAAIAESSGLLDGSGIAGRVASLPRRPGESAADYARRSDALRERIGSEALLLERRLGEIYETTVYPPGFPVDRVVAEHERQWIESLPEADRETMLRDAVEARELRRAEPRFEHLETTGAQDDAAGEL